LGLSVLTSPEYTQSSLGSVSTVGIRDADKSQISIGGKGLTVKEVVVFLESVSPSSRPAAIRPLRNSSLINLSSNSSGGDKTIGPCPLNIAGVTFPLTSGKLLAVAYLEWLVGTGSAAPHVHDDYIQALMENIPLSFSKYVFIF
jgi:hypothetical protein